MEKAEIDSARAAAINVMNTLSPLVRVMEQAGSVLSVLSNSEKLRLTLEQEVSGLRGDVEQLRSETSALMSQKEALQQAVGLAEAKAAEAVQAAAAAAEQAARRAEADALARAEAAAKAAAAKEAEFTAHIQDVQRRTDAAVAELFTRQETVAQQAADAEARLEAVRQQAAKFAASLGT